jgi:hypothetical protein
LKHLTVGGDSGYYGVVMTVKETKGWWFGRERISVEARTAAALLLYEEEAANIELEAEEGAKEVLKIEAAVVTRNNEEEDMNKVPPRNTTRSRTKLTTRINVERASQVTCF